MTNKLRVAMIGAGQWGPNIVRLLLDDRRCQLVGIAKLSEKRRAVLADRYDVPVTPDANVFLDDATVDAVVIATPASSHYHLSRQALIRGKHVLVEKPITTDAREGDALCELARTGQRVLMVGHVFVYNAAYQALCRIVNQPDFGRVIYIYSRRLSLGPVREDVHAGWDLAAHDISMILQLKGCLPTAVTSSSHAVIRPQVADVIFATLAFADGTRAHLHTSWLDPQKVRELVVVGENKMVVFDDMNLREPIRIYNKSFHRVNADPPEKVVDTVGAFRVELQTGDIVIPAISSGEPLAREIDDFVESIQSHRTPISDGVFGVQVVRVLEAMDQSIGKNSLLVHIGNSDT